MNKILSFLLLFFSLNAFCQKEASNWYFGSFAGIRFLDDGSVVALADGKMDTNEGCSVMSDPEGNLLFYTDGRNVWDRNHIKMPNGNYDAGNGLMGDPSSTQSGIIVPKKGDPNIYYIFTVDEPHHANAEVYPAQYAGTYPENGLGVPETDDGFNNGLNYSVVDLSVTGSNGSIGDIVTRNIHLVTYNQNDPAEVKYKCSEKVTAVQNSNRTGFWVVTQFVNRFYAFFVDENGVNATPVVTQIEPVAGTDGYRRNAIGYIKASPNGKKLAIAHNQRATLEGSTTQNGTAYLYDFDNAGGTVSNAIQLSDNSIPYGLEFSSRSRKLYITYDATFTHPSGLYQYDLEAADIPASETFIAPNSVTASGLQLGLNNKIYIARNGQSSLDAINLPDESGISCNFEANAVGLGAGRRAIFGLPPFITSLFSASILAESTCLGDTTQFSLKAIGNFQSVSWNFGDGSGFSSNLAPTHVYAASGIYNVVATITNFGEVYTITEEVTIYSLPIANTASALIKCDPENDGIEVFNLSENDAMVLGNQNAAAFEVKYFASLEAADANTDALNAFAFSNTSSTQTLFARVHQKANTACYSTTAFEISVTPAPVMNAVVYEICDDAADGNDANGRAEFNMAAVTLALVQNSTLYTVTYHASEGGANAPFAPLPAMFYNTTSNEQTVYARIVNNAHANCITVVPITLTVNPLPNAVTSAALVQCLNPEGTNLFNLAQADAEITGGNAALSVSYYPTATDAEDDTNVINGPYANTSNPQIIAARVWVASTGCYRILPVTLTVITNIMPAVQMERCDDDGTEDGFAEFDLTLAGTGSGSDNVLYYSTILDALMEENPVLPHFTNTIAHTQTVYARVENNNECTALQPIELIVRPLPDIDVEDTAIVCLNTKDFIRIDAGVLGNAGNYAFTWSTGAATHSILVNQPGSYTVEVTDISSPSSCSKLRTITVVPSDLAVIDKVIVEDLRDNNTITVFVHPGNNVATTYMYSLDSPNGPWQESNFFENVGAGLHTVYVYDTNGCGIIPHTLSVLAVPKFFSPNGDGINDTWNITGINALFYNMSKIRIFDRYGKLLADVSPKSEGWDGSYHGTPLPATDYWYVLELNDGRTVRGHFSMVR
ncbi:T9SS type B sorting domain-containing protein [uncultured Flavobacterium sp.]|uniref:T9SS type B sorting domain-containing protein n=1 Tax=uncultured Flavobacterium sp. TaxID=165435 RepID=UPI0025F82D05|nr:T9SS type B sorting domain-containing protein [uncultured Flavobacterium sp.]